MYYVWETQVADSLWLNSLTEKIIGAAIEVHRCLGPGLLESIYEKALCFELTSTNISWQIQVPVEITYKGRLTQAYTWPKIGFVGRKSSGC